MPELRCRWLVVGLMLAALLALLTLAADVSAQPGGIELEQRSADMVVLTWPEAARADQYQLRWYRGSRLASAQTVVLPAATRRYRIDDLRARSLYFLRVQALSADGAVLQTWNHTALPFASDARWWHARLRSAEGSLHLSWEPPAAWSPDGYRVRWRHVDTLTWQPTVELSADVRAYTISGLSAGQSYTVRLSAYQSGANEGQKRPSNIEAGSEPPLRLTLTAPLKLCDANTETELSWDISGGRAPYQLQVDGVSVDPDAEAHQAHCGSILIDPSTEEPLTNPTQVINALSPTPPARRAILGSHSHSCPSRPLPSQKLTTLAIDTPPIWLRVHIASPNLSWAPTSPRWSLTSLPVNIVSAGGTPFFGTPLNHRTPEWQFV